MTVLGYLLASLTGISLGLIGSGGSILMVPILVYLFDTPPILATAYSLFIVGLTSLVGCFNYAKKSLIDYKTAIVFALPAFLGVFLARSYVIPNLPETIANIGAFSLSRDILIMLVFAVVMVLAAFSMIKKKPPEEIKSSSDSLKKPYNFPLISLEGLVVGAITGFVGAGGGFLIIPALVILVGIPMKIAVGTSLLIISFKSLFGFIGDLTSGQIMDWNLLVIISAVSIVGILIGTYLSKFIPGKKLQPAFGWFTLLMGLFILYKQFI